jgi:hypothetical protein
MPDPKGPDATPSGAPLSVGVLAQHTVERRAVEAVIWGMPAVNFDLMYQAMVDRACGAFNQIVYWSRLPDWRNQTLTPNPDVIYVMPFINTKDVGPMVLEIPAAKDGSITGTIMDCWQAALEDVGPAGADSGNGARYLILPPSYTADVPDGYIVLRSDTFEGYALLRSVLQSGSDADLAKAVTYAKQIRLYPLSRAGDPPPTTFVDAANVVFDATIPYDRRFFQSLNRMVQREPWLERDKVMIDVLKSIGISKGERFEPGAQTQLALRDAACEAHAWLDARYQAAFTPYNEGFQWTVPALPDLEETAATFFEKENAYSLDARGLTYHFAFSSIKHLGAGQFYLLTIRDGGGRVLDGGSDYRLTVPPRVPVRQYWSATVYDRESHAFIRNLPRTGRSSQSRGLVTSTDGSVDIWFGPRAPEGRETNWVPTRADGCFEVLFRFYGPQKALYDRTWKLPDIERLGSH